MGKIQKNTEREEFALWLARPTKDRHVDGKKIPSEQDFADHYKMHRTTLTKWKKDPKFNTKVHEYRMALMGSRTGDVLNNMVEQASTTDNAAMIKLCLEYMNEYRPTQEIIHSQGGSATGGMLDSVEFIDFFAEQLVEHPILADYNLDAETVSFAIRDIAKSENEEEEENEE
jgi:hypothetical protein